MSKKQSCSTPCTITKWVVGVLLFLATLAALAGMFQTHVIDMAPVRMQFGSTSGSLSILAFCVALVSLMKHMVCSMGKCEVCSK